MKELTEQDLQALDNEELCEVLETLEGLNEILNIVEDTKKEGELENEKAN